MSTIYEVFGTRGQQLAYKLLTKLQPDLTADMKVGIKPNLVLAKESNQGATTDPALVAGIIKYLQDQDIYDIMIMEGAWVGADTERAFQVCGYRELAKQYEVKLYNLKDDQTKIYTSGNLEIEVCQSPLKVDYLINVPVLKAHCQTKMTCALKNFKGCLPDAEKRRFHTLGLHQPIAHLNTILTADLTIVDGLIGDLTFEEGGNPVVMNRVLAGYDPVLIDSYVAQLMGLDVEAVEYIKLAEKLGVGSANLKAATINSLNKPQVAKNLANQVESSQVQDLKEQIKERQACSACLGGLIHALQRIKKHSGLPAEQIYIGQGWQDKPKSGIGVGNCTAKFSTSITGCPPTAKQMIEELTKYWKLK